MKIQPTLYIGESFYDHWRIFMLPMLFHNSNADKVISLQNVDIIIRGIFETVIPTLEKSSILFLRTQK